MTLETSGGAGAGPGVSRLIRDIMTQYETPLLRYAARLVNDVSLAQDVVQETLIRLHRHLDGGGIMPENLKSWLYRVAHNQAVDLIRREQRLRLLHENEAEARTASAPRVDEAAEREEAMERVIEEIQKLSDKERQVVLLRLQEGMSYRDISQVTGETEGNIGYLLHHAVRKLGARLRGAAERRVPA